MLCVSYAERAVLCVMCDVLVPCWAPCVAYLMLACWVSCVFVNGMLRVVSAWRVSGIILLRARQVRKTRACSAPKTRAGNAGTGSQPDCH